VHPDAAHMMGAYLSTGEAARRCGVSRHAVLRAARRGDLSPSWRSSAGHLRFCPADVAVFAARLTTSGSATSDTPMHDCPALIPDAALYRSFFEESLSVMLMIDPGNGRIVHANRAACRFYGYSHE
jgi:PAS domain-containing protein